MEGGGGSVAGWKTEEGREKLFKFLSGFYHLQQNEAIKWINIYLGPSESIKTRVHVLYVVYILAYNV